MVGLTDSGKPRIYTKDGEFESIVGDAAVVNSTDDDLERSPVVRLGVIQSLRLRDGINWTISRAAPDWNARQGKGRQRKKHGLLITGDFSKLVLDP
jgi:hypothetical protein